MPKLKNPEFESPLELAVRPRRLRSSPVLRESVAETYLRPDHFIAPFFF